jgi:hypothetical protein
MLAPQYFVTLLYLSDVFASKITISLCVLFCGGQAGVDCADLALEASPPPSKLS